MERTEVNELEEAKKMPDCPARDAMLMRVAERLVQSGELHKYISPAGALGLPKLLDERRLHFGIPDSVFTVEAVFDRILVYQLPRVFGDLAEGTSIIKPASVRKREEESCPRGVIVSAGLRALDNLLPHGIELGSIVNFIRLAPWRMTVQEIAGVEINVLILRDGDLTASEDLAAKRRAGKLSTVSVQTPDGLEHRLSDGGNPTLKTKQPWLSEDY